MCVCVQGRAATLLVLCFRISATEVQLGLEFVRELEFALESELEFAFDPNVSPSWSLRCRVSLRSELISTSYVEWYPALLSPLGPQPTKAPT